MSKARLLLADERGLTATEYALLASMVSLATLGAILLLGAALTNHYGKLADEVIAVTP